MVIFQRSCLKWPHEITQFNDVKKATTPIWITGKYEHWSNTDNKIIKSLFYKRLFVKESL